MPDKVKIARLCLIVGGGLKIAAALLFLFIFATGAVFVGWEGERAELLGSALLGSTGVLLFFLFAVLGAVDILTADGVGRGKRWSRPLGIVLAVGGLPLFPAGTVLGALVLSGLLGPEGRAWFGSSRPLQGGAEPRPAAIRVKLSVVLAGVALLPLFLPASQQVEAAAEGLRETAAKVFVDCHQCDMDYIRNEITFVNFVRERRAADVYIMVTIQLNGGGGREYTLDFVGRNGYYDIHNTLKYVSRREDTNDDQRRGLARVLKVGLVPFAARTAMGDFLDVNFEKKVLPRVTTDAWNAWVFSVGVSGSMSGEASRDFASLSGYFSANRVTPERKLRLGLSANLNSSRFRLEEETLRSSADSQSFSGLYVVSLTGHLSAGSWLAVSSSSYHNIALAINPAPAVEYNFFPYDVSTRRQLRLLYRIGFHFNRYEEETIYDKTRENVLGQTLSMTLEIKEPWGHISSSLTGSNLLTDFSKNRLEFWGGVSLHVFKGLAVNVSGQYSRIHDQISLPKSGATLDEILLQRKMLATNYNYGLSVGVSYTFGSVFSGVVNPRFGR
jgi:hypothetical protein